MKAPKSCAIWAKAFGSTTWRKGASIVADAHAQADGFGSQEARWRIAEPYNVGSGWVGFDFAAAFGCPVKVVNDAAMQALGSYKAGLGSTIIVDGIVEPMELGHLPYMKGTYEDYVGWAGLARKEEMAANVADVVARLIRALEPDDTVLGGGNVKKLEVAQAITPTPFAADFGCGKR